MPVSVYLFKLDDKKVKQRINKFSMVEYLFVSTIFSEGIYLT